MARRSSHTPTGVTLKQLAQGFQAQGLEVPEHIQKLMDENAPKRVNRTPGKPPIPEGGPSKLQAKPVTEAPAQTAVAVQPQAQPATPTAAKTKVTHSLLQSLLGKNIANKLIKKAKEHETAGQVADAKQHRDIKEIKASLAEIREHLKRKQKRVPSRYQRMERSDTTKPTTWKRKFGRGMIQSTGLSKLGVGTKNRKGDFKHAFFESSGLSKLGFGQDEESKHERLSKPEAVQAATALHTDLTAPAPQKVPAPSHAAQDQQEVQTTKIEDKREKEAKSIHNKLDKILALLKKIKANENSGGGLFGMVAAALAMAKNILSKFAPLVKLIGKLGSGLAKMVAGALSKTWKGVKAVGKGISYVARKIWNGGKKILKGGEAEGAEAAEGTEAATAGEVAGGEAMGAGALAGSAALVAGAGVAGYAAGKGIDWATKKLTGESLSERVSRGISDITGAGKSTPQPVFNINKYKQQEAQRSAAMQVPKKTPQTLLTATDVAKSNQQKDQAKPASNQPIIIKGGDTTKVVQVPAQKGSLPTAITTRNGERSLSRLTSTLFDDPAGWAGVVKL